MMRILTHKNTHTNTLRSLKKKRAAVPMATVAIVFSETISLSLTPFLTHSLLISLVYLFFEDTQPQVIVKHYLIENHYFH